MKIFTKSFTSFIIFAAIFTIIFRASLSALLNNESYIMVWVAAVAYGILMFVIGVYFGKRDSIESVIYNLFLRWNGGTFIVFGIISYVWMLFGNPAPSESLGVLNITMIIWATIGVVVYLIMRHYSIKGIEKSEIFD